MSTWCRSTVNQRIVNTTRRLLGTKTFIVRLTNDSDSFEISPVEKGFIADEPGHMLTNSITKLTSRYAFSISICNHTNKTILFRRGCVVGKSSPLSSEEISDVFTHLLQILLLTILTFRNYNVNRTLNNKLLLSYYIMLKFSRNLIPILDVHIL